MFKVEEMKFVVRSLSVINVYCISGVGFTKYCRDNCSNAGIRGWVKNSKRGTIVGKMQGLKPEIDKM
jgi:acylphosphatase